MLSTIGADGVAAPVQPLGFRTVAMVGTIASSTSFSYINHPNVNTAGTATARAPTSTNYGTRHPRVGMVSDAPAASVALIRAALPSVYIANEGWMSIQRFMISDAVLVATANMFVGRVTTAFTTDVTPSTQTRLVGVGCDNGDTTLQLYAAGAVAQSRTDLGANFPVNTVSTDVYELVLRQAPGSSEVGYRVTRLNTGHVASGLITDAAKLNSGGIGMQMSRSNGGTASAVGIDIMHSYLERP